MAKGSPCRCIHQAHRSLSQIKDESLRACSSKALEQRQPHIATLQTAIRDLDRVHWEVLLLGHESVHKASSAVFVAYANFVIAVDNSCHGAPDGGPAQLPDMGDLATAESAFLLAAREALE